MPAGSPQFFSNGLPGEGWLDWCSEFPREAHLRTIEPRQAQKMLQGDLFHQALLLLPRIHAGLVNTLRITVWTRPNGTDRRPAHQRLSKHRTQPAELATGPETTVLPSGPRSPKMVITSGPCLYQNAWALKFPAWPRWAPCRTHHRLLIRCPRTLHKPVAQGPSQKLNGREWLSLFSWPARLCNGKSTRRMSYTHIGINLGEFGLLIKGTCVSC